MAVQIVGGTIKNGARGGPVYSRLLLEACLLCSDEIDGAKSSPHEARYFDALMAAVNHDRMVEAPETLGSNRRNLTREDIRFSSGRIITYKGVEY